MSPGRRNSFDYIAQLSTTSNPGMIIYGDPRFQVSGTQLATQLGRRLKNLRRQMLEQFRNKPSRQQKENILAQTRTLLIQAGELEQAFSDRFSNPYFRITGTSDSSHAEKVTDGAAALFYSEWAGSQIQVPTVSLDSKAALDLMVESLEHLDCVLSEKLTLKLPEGFAFYSLFPEQYLEAALQWASSHRQDRPKRALVVGIRSIGTSLSAAVAACLRSMGWKIRRITIRPYGHPFDRKIRLPFSRLQENHVLVVDEGPGASGSSFAAVVQRLIQAGSRFSQISILPGHGNGPGHATSRDIIQCWKFTSQIFVPVENLRWYRRSLQSRFSRTAQQFCRVRNGRCRMEDLSGGKWRKFHFQAEADWPAVALPFERVKHRCCLDNKQSILWKFAGLGPSPNQQQTLAEASLQEMNHRAKLGWLPAPMGILDGFIAMPWIDGGVLKSEDAHDPIILEHIGRHLIEVAGHPLAASEQEKSWKRLQRMLFWNLQKLFGRETCPEIEAWVRTIKNRQPCPSSGDRQPSPHHWVRTSQGRLFKFGGTHQVDHTWIGKQTWNWDLAGTIIEWDLSQNQSLFLISLAEAAKIHVDPHALTFFRLAYATYQAGLMHFNATSLSSGHPEQPRLFRAHARYRKKIRRILEEIRSSYRST